MTALSTLLGSRNWSDVPCGTFFPYGGSSAPTGFLMCDGSAVSRTTYSDLFAVFSTTFGAGDGSTTFNVPDLRGRGVIGAGTGTGGGASGTGAPTGGSALTARALGAWLGAETHVLTEAELATHYHGVGGNTAYSSGLGLDSATGTQQRVNATRFSTDAGSNTAHNNIQPVIASNWIVKAVRAFSGSQSFLSRGFIDGLITSNAADADHDITISVGACRDSSDAYNMVLSSVFTKQIDASWAAGSAAGGLFSGSVGNATWYHVFLIRKDADGSIDAGFDTSVTAANRPAGYSTYRRIGSVLTDDSANIVAFKQYGDVFRWATVVNDMQTTPTAGSPQTVTITVPTGIVVKALLWVWYVSTAVGYSFESRDYDNLAYGSFAYTQVSSLAFFGSEGQHVTNTSAQIKYLATNADGTASLRTNGWIDPRGKDA